MAKLSLRNISKKYEKGIIALANLYLNIDDNQFVSVIGPPFSGKTTLLTIIGGFQDSTAGQVYIDDINIDDIRPDDLQIVMMSKGYSFYPDMNAFENMAFGLRLKGLDTNIINTRIMNISKILNIEHILQQKTQTLSELQKRKLMLGKLAVKNPKIFLLDEPLTGLSSNLKNILKQDIANLFKHLKASFIYVPTEPMEVFDISDKVLVIKDGIIQQFDIPENIYNNPNNVHVASCLGIPQINLFESVLIKDKNDYLLKFSNYYIKWPAEKLHPIFSNSLYHKVILGFRPQDLIIQESNEPSNYIKGIVNLIEKSLNGTFLYLKVDNIPLTLYTEKPVSYKIGDIIYVDIDIENIHIFDKKTNISIKL